MRRKPALSSVRPDVPPGAGLAPDGKLIMGESGAKLIVEIDPHTGDVIGIVGDLAMGCGHIRSASAHQSRSISRRTSRTRSTR